MKKLTFVFALGVFGLILSGCSNSNSTHEHNYSSEWTYDETYHWHAATCEHAEEVIDKAKHQFGGWIEESSPTEDEEGRKYRQCSICEYKEYQSISKLDHVHIGDLKVKENEQQY